MGLQTEMHVTGLHSATYAACVKGKPVWKDEHTEVAPELHTFFHKNLKHVDNESNYFQPHIGEHIDSHVKAEGVFSINLEFLT